MIASAKQRSIFDRMLGAALLEVNTYEEVEHDQSATGQALLVVVMAAIAAGIGGLREGLEGLVVAIILALIGWALYALITYWVGTTFFKGPQTSATWGELLRTLGFAQSPRILLVFAFIPVIGGIVIFAVFIWILVTTVIAIRQALDFDTLRAIATAVVSLVVLFITNWLFFILLT